MTEDVPEPLNYKPAPRARSAPDPQAVAEVADALVKAERPVIYAGQGVHYARAWQRAARAGRAARSAGHQPAWKARAPFPRTIRCRSASGSRSIPKAVRHFLNKADVIFGIGCSFATTNYGVRLPRKGPSYIQATLDAADLNKELPIEHALLGDAELTLAGADRRGRDGSSGKPRGRADGVAAGDRARSASEWLAEWKPKLTSNDDAAVAVPRHLGPAAHRRRGQHDHHPRRRQPARPARAVLAADRAAQLHRLGQDHPARLRPGTGHGRQAGAPGQAVHQRLG